MRNIERERKKEKIGVYMSERRGRQKENSMIPTFAVMRYILR